MKKLCKLTRKMRRLQTLDAGRQQFAPLARPAAYVFVNNISLPVA